MQPAIANANGVVATTQSKLSEAGPVGAGGQFPLSVPQLYAVHYCSPFRFLATHLFYVAATVLTSAL
jgi:hypothetical protein